MIGTELLQLLQGDPLAQMRQQMGGPNPNPQAPPPAAAPTAARKSADDATCASAMHGAMSLPRPLLAPSPVRSGVPMPPQGAPPAPGGARAASTGPAAVWTAVRGPPEPARPGSIVQSADATATVGLGDRPRPRFDGLGLRRAWHPGPDHALDGQPAA